ncbi:hypothetical protein AAHU49_06900 [Klebsiella quasipneumoniae subsp. quasipneumoniae]|uniref:hypothetical protein n=1 Tax=Klebsiella TaxID=570 RepID=UPI0015C18266|nr:MULTISPECIES: hypothetical protein [Klebsiella]MDI3434788.1 hypothetical protein [Klebsiella sp. V115_8]NWM02099.1 hypothetical protein [Klebsiella quasipneumoniae]HCI6529958.1 hypothetical protein [Klebsiella quasipneumoniae subsp. quasipneumoniae]
MLLRYLFLIILITSSGLGHTEVKRITIYNDGNACPGNCDAHVVFPDVMNGTEYAHDPLRSSNGKYEKCINGHECTICLESGEKQCLGTIYRGTGPHANTFDFTPAFYQMACNTVPKQSILAKQCNVINKNQNYLKRKTNCITNPKDQKCILIMKEANAAKELDNIKYQKCLSEGEKKYNPTVSKDQRRDDNCNYELMSTGRNSRGKTWQKLLPAACGNMAFMGKGATDCCTGNTFTDGGLFTECSPFYP